MCCAVENITYRMSGIKEPKHGFTLTHFQYYGISTAQQVPFYQITHLTPGLPEPAFTIL